MRTQFFLALLFVFSPLLNVSFGETIVATGGNDLIVVNVAAQRVFVNGAMTAFDRVDSLRIRGGGGDDRVVINGAVASLETVRMEALGFRLLDSKGLIFGENVEEIEFRGQVSDACVMVGTGGPDDFKLGPASSELTTPLATFTANAVARVNVQGQGGDDVVDVANPVLRHVTCDTDTVRIPGVPGVYPTRHTILGFERVNTTESVKTFNFFNEDRTAGELLVLRRRLRWSSENLDLFHDGAYDSVHADTFRSVVVRVPEIDGCRFDGDFEGNRDDGDPDFLFSDDERRINMRNMFQCTVEVLPGPSTQTSRSRVKDRRNSNDNLSASLETGIVTGRYGRGPRNLSVSGFDFNSISRREADNVTNIEGSSGDDTLIFPGGVFTGNGHEFVVTSFGGVVFDGKEGHDELFVMGGGRIAASTSEVETNFSLSTSSFSAFDGTRTRMLGFEERTIIGDSTSEIYLLMNDGIRVSPDRATVNDGGILTNAIGFGTYFITGSQDLFSSRGAYGNNVVYNNQNDPTLVQRTAREFFDLTVFIMSPFFVDVEIEYFTTNRAVVGFFRDVDFRPVANFDNIRVVNP